MDVQSSPRLSFLSRVRPVEISRLIDAGVIAVRGEPHPGAGRPRDYDPGTDRDLEVWEQLNRVVGQAAQGRHAVAAELLALWRELGRPAGYLIWRGVDGATWRAPAADLTDLLASGHGVIVLPVGGGQA